MYIQWMTISKITIDKGFVTCYSGVTVDRPLTPLKGMKKGDSLVDQWSLRIGWPSPYRTCRFLSPLYTIVRSCRGRIVHIIIICSCARVHKLPRSLLMYPRLRSTARSEMDRVTKRTFADVVKYVTTAAVHIRKYEFKKNWYTFWYD